MHEIALGAAGMLTTLIFWFARCAASNLREEVMLWKWIMFNAIGIFISLTTAFWWMGKVLVFSTGWGG